MDIVTAADGHLIVTDEDGFSFTVRAQDALGFLRRFANGTPEVQPTSLARDGEEIEQLLSRTEVLLAQRRMLAEDVLATDRNERLDAIDRELRELRDRITDYLCVMGIIRAGREA